MAKKTKYVLSFTAGGLLYHESVVVAETYADCKDWKKTTESVAAQNLLQSRTASTAKRKLREVRQRLQCLTEEQLDLLARGTRTEQRWLLWLACCRRYQLLTDFATEVLHGKFVQLDLLITSADIERFIESKSVWHEELDNLAESTRKKLQTVMMRMLRESEMVSDDGVITPPLMSNELLDVIVADSPKALLLFPVAESAMRRNAS